MISNLEKYKNDLEKLINKGDKLYYSICNEFNPIQYREVFSKNHNKKEFEEYINELPSFKNTYQEWYSEALIVVKQLLSDRLNDFIKLYQKIPHRKEITYENYSIEDYFQGLTVTRGYEKTKIVGPEAAVPKYYTQLNILKSVKSRFESSLFDIKQLVQADLFDSELEAAKELNKKGFVRGAGAIAGVVLEKHLAQVCDNHNITITKKNSTMNDLNQLLKDNEVIEIKDWRFNQHLGDLRNLCDHNKIKEPKKEDIEELINGVEKISKTIF